MTRFHFLTGPVGCPLMTPSLRLQSPIPTQTFSLGIPSQTRLQSFTSAFMENRFVLNRHLRKPFCRQKLNKESLCLSMYLTRFKNSIGSVTCKDGIPRST